MQQCLAKGPARGFLTGFCVVDSADAALVVTTIGILSVADDEARVQQRATKDPQRGRHLAWR